MSLHKLPNEDIFFYHIPKTGGRVFKKVARFMSNRKRLDEEKDIEQISKLCKIVYREDYKYFEQIEKTWRIREGWL